MVKEDGGRLGGTRSRRSLRLGAVLVAVSAAVAVAFVGTAGLAHGEELGDETTVQMRLGATPVITVAGATPQADAVAALTQHLAVVAQKTGAPALEELPIQFEAPVSHEPTDPAYDGMVLGPQPYGRAGGITSGE